MKNFFLAVSVALALAFTGFVATKAMAGGPAASPVHFPSTGDFGGKHPVVMHQISDGGVANTAMETKVVVLAAGTATWTFTEAFAWPPVCVCNDTVADAGGFCAAGGTTTTTALVTGTLTPTCGCICVGAR